MSDLSKTVYAPRYKYEPGNFGGFIILQRVDEGRPGAWEGFGYVEIGEWCATEQEAKDCVQALEDKPHE